jgi:hypothetical protein
MKNGKKVEKRAIKLPRKDKKAAKSKFNFV